MGLPAIERVTVNALPKGRPLRIVAVDDHPVVVDGVLAALQAHADGHRPTEFLGSARTAQELFTMLENFDTPPDIALVDLHLHDGSEPEDTIGALSDAGVIPVVLTSEVKPVPIRRAIAAGAQGLVLKSDPPEDIARVVGDVADSDFSVSSDLAFVLANDEQIVANLTRREQETLQLMAEGFTRQEVAKRLEPPVSMTTVSTYLERVFRSYRKRGREVNSIVGAIREASRDGYVSYDSDIPENGS